ncbi:hypothetical protein [uncultured Actinomyces sp.]|uniref:hypothetical protein n=1 Tax=uncultured Actinomyces sp. TaxID=249061 RepID=UPI0026337CE7|nr:hypothetical protein [uncultured Actinomyces sp.]
MRFERMHDLRERWLQATAAAGGVDAVIDRVQTVRGIAYTRVFLPPDYYESAGATPTRATYLTEGTRAADCLAQLLSLTPRLRDASDPKSVDPVALLQGDAPGVWSYYLDGVYDVEPQIVFARVFKDGHSLEVFIPYDAALIAGVEFPDLEALFEAERAKREAPACGYETTAEFYGK